MVTAFVADPIPKGVLDAVGFRPGRRGANVWLVTPNDEGVFAGAAEVGVAVCAHPVQVYLDLAAQPERATEAAEELRQRLLVGCIAMPKGRVADEYDAAGSRHPV